MLNDTTIDRLEVDEPCVICSGNRFSHLFEARPGFSLIRCDSCGVVLTNPYLSGKDMAGYYPPSYYGRKNKRFHPVLEKFIALLRLRRVGKIEQFSSRGRILDVGCGRGQFLDFLRKHGWETQGLEISETAADYAKNVLGLSIYIGDLHAASYPYSHFDTIVLWHVLEHMREPRKALEECGRILKPGGLIVISLPNFDSFQVKATGKNCFHLDVPRHYCHFPLPVLHKLLDECGFKTRHINHFCFEQNYYAWVQALLNRMGFRFNLLYDMIKSRSARTIQGPFSEYPVQSILTLASLAGVLPLSAFMFLAEWMSRKAVSVELYATRM